MKYLQELWRELTPLYDTGEAKALVRTVLEVHFGLTFPDILCGKVNEFSAEQRQTLEKIMARLRRGEPVQYILGQTDFCGHRLTVSPKVLIPRPETAELCQLILQEQTGGDILDIGTGSGCIAITLALALGRKAQVTAWDLSEEALEVAERNARHLDAPVKFLRQDALSPPATPEKWEAIVSNPPYVTEKEKSSMERNVLDHEPPMALFVPDDDPLRFYRSITRYAVQALQPGGTLYFEINPLYQRELETLVRESGFPSPALLPDAFGKVRFLKARKEPLNPS